MSFCEAHVLWLGILLEEDRETQKIPLNYAMNYARGVASKIKFKGFLPVGHRRSVVLSPTHH